MTDTTSPTSLLKNRTVIITLVVTIVVILIWLVAFFLPQGSKLSKLNTQEQSLQLKVKAGQAKVAQLKSEALHTPQLQAMSRQLNSYVPSSPGTYTYITTMSNTAAAAKVTIVSLGLGTEAETAGATFSSIQCSVSVTGTYDQLLAFIQDIYGLPRLTQINSVSFSGGGTGTNRGTVLSMSASLTIFTSAKITPAA